MRLQLGVNHTEYVFDPEEMEQLQHWLDGVVLMTEPDIIKIENSMEYTEDAANDREFPGGNVTSYGTRWLRPEAENQAILTDTVEIGEETFTANTDKGIYFMETPDDLPLDQYYISHRITFKAFNFKHARYQPRLHLSMREQHGEFAGDRIDISRPIHKGVADGLHADAFEYFKPSEQDILEALHHSYLTDMHKGRMIMHPLDQVRAELDSLPDQLRFMAMVLGIDEPDFLT